MSRPLLVVVGYVWPEPNSSAAGGRILSVINFFRTHDWQIIFASAAAVSEHRFNLQSIGVAEQTILLNDSSFDSWIKDLSPQAVLFDRFFTEEQFGWRVELSCPNALRLLDTEDFHGLRKVRQALLKKSLTHINENLMNGRSGDLGVVKSSSETLFGIMIHDDTVQRELAAILRCDLSLMISTYEIELLHQYFQIPQQQLFYLPLLIDSALSDTPNFAERKDFIAMGNFRHEPNWDSVQLLKQWIWPALRKKLLAKGITAELKIYGAYPPPKATELNNAREGFLVKGWAEDAHEVLMHARVCLAPLRFGAGQKGKLVSAMLAGTPNVTTSLGAEAMCGEINNLAAAKKVWSGAIEDELSAYVEAAEKLYLSEADWRDAQQKGFDLLAKQFYQGSYAEGFFLRINSLLADLPTHRNKNVFGVLLRHQQHRATQYMGQWIEEKNKPRN